MVSLTIFPEQNQDILSTQQSCQTGAVAVGLVLFVFIVFVLPDYLDDNVDKEG